MVNLEQYKGCLLYTSLPLTEKCMTSAATAASSSAAPTAWTSGTGWGGGFTGGRTSSPRKRSGGTWKRCWNRETGRWMWSSHTPAL